MNIIVMVTSYLAGFESSEPRQNFILSDNYCMVILSKGAKEVSSNEKYLIEKFESLKNRYPSFLIILLYSIICLVLLPPFVIWLLYRIGDNKVIIPTSYVAGDLLGYHGSLLGFVGTVILGAVSLYLNKKANDNNEKLMEIEKSRDKPKIDIEGKKIKYVARERMFDFGDIDIDFINHGGIAEKFKFTLEGIAFSDDNIVNAYNIGKFNCYPINVTERKEYSLSEFLIKSSTLRIAIDDIDALARNIFIIEGFISYYDVYGEKIERYVTLFYEKDKEQGNTYEFCGFKSNNQTLISK